MPNLNLTHSGNMNITSASIGSGGTLNVQYEPNTTGAITGWTFTPDSGRTDWESGETITIRFTPQFSGTVLTETFTVSGVDESGVRRSDSSVLRQGFDTNLFHHIPNPRLSLQGVTVNSSAFTENYMEFNVTLQGNGPRHYCQVLLYDVAAFALWTGYIETEPGPDTGTVASSLTLVVDDTITDNGQASATYTPSDAYVDLHYYAYDIDGGYLRPSTAVTINETTGEITVLANGTVRICVEDTISNRLDCENVEVVKTGPDTGDTYITSLTLNVASSITDYGVATASYTPSNATVSLSYYVYADDGQFTNPTNLATMNIDTGEITVYGTGSVAVEVYDFLTGLFDRKVINVVKTQPGPDTGDTGGTGEVIVYYNATSTGSSIRILNSTYGVSTYPYAPPFASGVTEYDASVPLSNSTYRFSQIQQGGTPIHYTISDSAATHLWANADPTIEPNALGAMAFAEVSTIKKVEILGGVKYIGDSCFSGCTSLDTVIIDEGVINMAHRIFANCTSLRNVEMPESMGVDYPNWLYGFGGCTSLTDITLPSGLRTIPDYSFTGCTSLETITMPSGLTEINQRAFAGCTSLREINLNDGITTFDGGCFENCTSLTGVTFPASVTMVGGWAFDGCSGITKMVFEGATPPRLSSNANPLGDPSYRFLIYVPCESVTAYRTAMPDYATRITCEDAPEEEYATSVSLTVNGLVIDSGVVTMTPTPAYASVAPIYQSLNPDVVTVDPFTGELTVVGNGTATITGRDVLTNLSSEIDITCIKTIDPTPYKSDYLTFDIISAGTVILKSGLETGITIDVRVNGGSWQTKKPKSGTTINLSVSAGDKLEFRATRNRYNHSIFGSSGDCKFNISGNIMSIVNPNPSNFSGRTSLPDDYIFRDLFRSCTGIVDASCLVMPATALTKSCYERMFMNCTNMTTAPLLPATATRTAAISPTSASWCYRGMFNGCSSLSYVKCKLVTVTESGTIDDWLSGVAESGVFIKNPSANASVLQIPSTWTVISAT